MDILGRYNLDAIALCQVDKDALVLAHDVDALIGQQYLLAAGCLEAFISRALWRG